MVDKNINFFEKLTLAECSTSGETSSKKFRRYIAQMTEIKRPPGKSRPHSELTEASEKSATLPRRTLTRGGESSKIGKHASLRTHKEDYMKSVQTKSFKGILKKTQKTNEKHYENHEIQNHRTLSTSSTSSSRKTVKYNENHDSKTVKNKFLTEEFLESLSDSSEDIFGFNDFDDDCTDNYIIETYNRPGQELIITTLEITRKTVTQSEEKDLEDLIKDSDYVVHKNEFNSSEESIYDSIVTHRSYEESSFSHNFYEDSNFYQSIDSSESDIYDEVESDYVDMQAKAKQVLSLQNEDNFYHNLEDLCDVEEPDTEIKSLPAPKRNLESEQKVRYVIDEMIKTEQLYISGLQIIVEEYIPYLYRHTPPHLTGRTSYLFGNIQVIYEQAKDFLDLLRINSGGPDEVGQTFSQLAHIFDLYPQYSKNKPTADIYLKEFDDVVKEKQTLLRDKLGLASHLLTPIQRLGKYILMLEKIQKELKKGGTPLDSISTAISIIRKAMRKGNDFIAIDSIKECKIDLTLHGSFTMRSVFNILRPRKFMAMIFLFENVIVFTERVSKSTEQFRYIDHIQLSDLSLAKFEDKPCIFNLRDYPKYKKANNDGVTYILEAESPKLKNDWTQAIEEKLWKQLENAKEQQKKSPYNDFDSSVTLRPSLGRNNSKKKPKERSKSKFYSDEQPIS